MAWLQRPAAGHMTGVSNYGNKSDPYRGGNSALVGLNSSEGHESHCSSIPTGEDACLLPYSYDQSTGEEYIPAAGGKH